MVVKNLPASTGDVGDAGSTPGSERSPGEGNGNPLQRSCLENPTDRGAWQAIVRLAGLQRIGHDQVTEHKMDHSRTGTWISCKFLYLTYINMLWS